jgi:toxin CcdB
MARFDVYSNPDNGLGDDFPYLLDVQNTFIEVDTRAVVPLVGSGYLTRLVRDLNPEVMVSGKPFVMHTSAIGAVPTSELRRAVVNITDQQLAIQHALDTLFGGY